MQLKARGVTNSKAVLGAYDGSTHESGAHSKQGLCQFSCSL